MKIDPSRLSRAHYPFWIDLLTRYSDLDPQGHVNNVAIAEYYQEARLQFHLGAEVAEGMREGRALVAHHAMDYLAEVHYPGGLMAGIGVLDIGRTSYTLHLGLFQGERCLGVALTVMVYALAAGPAAVPAGMRAYLEKHRLSA